ncbi:MAG: nucleotide exchange factor GrpE [Deltaproteobacteria bacterium]|nr:nucleotide exchange factor GrpE [Deltaproteobacteria bacterium]
MVKDSETKEHKEDKEEEQKREEKEEKKDIEKELQDMKDKYLRSLAEFNNFRKREEKERMRLSDVVKVSVIRDFLPILDDLQKALENSKQHQSKITEGVELIVKKFNDILKNGGVKEIKTQGEVFNPHYHEALQVRQSDKYPPNLILETLEKGYMYKDILIKPARVIVSAKKEDIEGNEGGK